MPEPSTLAHRPVLPAQTHALDRASSLWPRSPSHAHRRSAPQLATAGRYPPTQNVASIFWTPRQVQPERAHSTRCAMKPALRHAPHSMGRDRQNLRSRSLSPVDPDGSSGLSPPGILMEVHGGEGVLRFFRYIADRTDIALGMFNSPSSGYVLTPAESAQIYQELPAVCATKEGAFRPAASRVLHEMAHGLVIWECDKTVYRAGWLRAGIVCPAQLGTAGYLFETPERR